MNTNLAFAIHQITERLEYYEHVLDNFETIWLQKNQNMIETTFEENVTIYKKFIDAKMKNVNKIQVGNKKRKSIKKKMQSFNSYNLNNLSNIWANQAQPKPQTQVCHICRQPQVQTYKAYQVYQPRVYQPQAQAYQAYNQPQAYRHNQYHNRYHNQYQIQWYPCNYYYNYK